jgi:hypothetical protein
MPHTKKIHPDGQSQITGKTVHETGKYEASCCSNIGDLNPSGMGIIEGTNCTDHDNGAKVIFLEEGQLFPCCELCKSDVIFIIRHDNDGV